MKLVMTLLARDEQDILRENLEFHFAQGVDEVIFMDNLSSDRTTAIAREYERAGRLHYLYQPDDTYAQGHWVTQMAQLAALRLSADWIVHCDADEFWHPESGTLKETLAAIEPATFAVSAERTNFIPRPLGDAPFWRRMDVRRHDSRNTLGAKLPAKVAHRAVADVVVEQGNHDIRVRGAYPKRDAAAITILHYPIRSRAQYINKIVKGGAAYARNIELPAAIGETWRHLYACYLAGSLDQAIAHEFLDEAAVAAGLADGSLVRDTTLIDAFARENDSAIA